MDTLPKELIYDILLSNRKEEKYYLPISDYGTSLKYISPLILNGQDVFNFSIINRTIYEYINANSNAWYVQAINKLYSLLDLDFDPNLLKGVIKIDAKFLYYALYMPFLDFIKKYAKIMSYSRYSIGFPEGKDIHNSIISYPADIVIYAYNVFNNDFWRIKTFLTFSKLFYKECIVYKDAEHQYKYHFRQMVKEWLATPGSVVQDKESYISITFKEKGSRHIPWNTFDGSDSIEIDKEIEYKYNIPEWLSKGSFDLLRDMLIFQSLIPCSQCFRSCGHYINRGISNVEWKG